MKNPLWFKLILVFSAYLPLFSIVLIKVINFEKFTDYFNSLINVFTGEATIVPTQTLGFIVFSSIMFAISIICSLIVTNEIRDTNKNKMGARLITLENIHSRQQDVLTYIATYILPLISLDTSTWNDLIIFIILIVIILLLSLSSDLLYVNPLLICLGFHLYSADTENGKALLISKLDNIQVQKNRNRICYRLEESILLDSGNKREWDSI